MCDACFIGVGQNNPAGEGVPKLLTNQRRESKSTWSPVISCRNRPSPERILPVNSQWLFGTCALVRVPSRLKSDRESWSNVNRRLSSLLSGDAAYIFAPARSCARRQWRTYHEDSMPHRTSTHHTQHPDPVPVRVKDHIVKRPILPFFRDLNHIKLKVMD